MSKEYDPKKIEPKWQKYWDKNNTYKDYNRAKKFYVLDFFPYPSGVGLHVGHPKGYIATDVVARMKMMQGYSVLHPMGWDAFGLPAENYAIKTKTQPSVAVEKNVAVFKKQLELFGFTYDWDLEINSTDPDYYKWTQWIFLKMFERGLAYQSDEPVNWCPSCKTVLANEDLEAGRCERCDSEIVQKKLRQWVLKMTNYADRLLADLNLPDLDWEEMIKEQQRNWIGRSEGAIIKFKCQNSNVKSSSQKSKDDFLEVFTTRIDTIYGCTYCVVAPEHEIITNYELQITNFQEVKQYIIKAQNKTELDRKEAKEKTGVEIKGIKVINPFNGQELPVFVADYVLGNYGTGAVMAVPAHDERDWEFAQKYDLPVIQIIRKENIVARSFLMGASKITDQELINIGVKIIGSTKDGDKKVEVSQKSMKLYIDLVKHKMDNGFWNEIVGDEILFIFKSKEGVIKEFILDINSSKEIEKMAADYNDAPYLGQASTWKWLAENDLYKDLIVHEEDGILVNSDKYSGLTSKEAREKMTAWLEKEKLGGKKINYKMRDWVFSRQRYWGEPIPIIHCAKCGAVGVPEKDLPVKLPEVKSYEPTGTGQSPLANIDSWVNTKCPKCVGPAKRETNTMPQWAGSCWYYLRYIDPKNNEELVDNKKEKKWMPVDLYVGGAEHAARHLLYARFWHKFLYDIGVVSTLEPFKRFIHVGLINGEDGRKMSKRWGNVVNPDDVINRFGADSVRLYEMFMGPFIQSIAWSTDGLMGTRRFLERVWRLLEKVEKEATENKEIEILVHKTIKKVSEDIENLHFNTALSSLMILSNELEKSDVIDEKIFKTLLILLSPFAPHMCEELFSMLKESQSIFLSAWPTYDAKKIETGDITLVIQINGKLRAKINIKKSLTQDEVEKIIKESGNVNQWIGDKKINKIIFVADKLINFVV